MDKKKESFKEPMFRTMGTTGVAMTALFALVAYLQNHTTKEENIIVPDEIKSKELDLEKE